MEGRVARPFFMRLERDDFQWNRHRALDLCLSMIFFRKPVSTFRDHARERDHLDMRYGFCIQRMMMAQTTNQIRVATK
jgi:hypothetical protein